MSTSSNIFNLVANQSDYKKYIHTDIMLTVNECNLKPYYYYCNLIGSQYRGKAFAQSSFANSNILLLFS